ICHTTGIPHSPPGQAVVERAHQTLKRVLLQQSSTTKTNSPVIRLAKALFTFNFLNITFEEPEPPVFRHFKNSGQRKLKENLEVLIKDPETQQVQGP
ncbi:IGEB protein, partial [Climacteris rufus]|nr:IGEB protein [Climacteris rufus]